MLAEDKYRSNSRGKEEKKFEYAPQQRSYQHNPALKCANHVKTPILHCQGIRPIIPYLDCQSINYPRTSKRDLSSLSPSFRERHARYRLVNPSGPQCHRKALIEGAALSFVFLFFSSQVFNRLSSSPLSPLTVFVSSTKSCDMRGCSGPTGTTPVVS